MQKDYPGYIYIDDACSVLITLFIIFFHVVFVFDLLKFIFISFLITLKRHLSLFLWSTCPLVEVFLIIGFIFDIIVAMVYEMRTLNHLLWFGRSSFALLFSLLHFWGALSVCELVVLVIDIVVIITVWILAFQLCGPIVIGDDFIRILRFVNLVIWLLLLLDKLSDCSDWLLLILRFVILWACPRIFRLSDFFALWVVWVSDLMEVLVIVLDFSIIILIIFFCLNDTRTNSCLVIIFKVTVWVLSTICTSRLTQDLLTICSQRSLFSPVLFSHPWVLVRHINMNGLVLYVGLD